MSDHYIGIEREAKFTLKTQGSVFYGFAFPMEDVVTVKQVLKNLQKDFPDATHICYAYRSGKFEQASDAGEPSHSAGTPILRKIHSRGLDQVLVCVVRYFGGTKLGIPGLIASYGECADKTLELAGSAEIPYKDIYYISCPQEETYLVYTFAQKTGGMLTQSKEGFVLSLERKFTSRIQEACEKFPKLQIKKIE